MSAYGLRPHFLPEFYGDNRAAIISRGMRRVSGSSYYPDQMASLSGRTGLGVGFWKALILPLGA